MTWLQVHPELRALSLVQDTSRLIWKGNAVHKDSWIT